MSTRSLVFVLLLVYAAARAWQRAQRPLKLPRNKILYYFKMIIGLWVLAALCTFVVAQDGQSLSDIGLHTQNLLVNVIIGLISAIALFAIAEYGLQPLLGKISETELTLFMLPERASEKLVFVIFSASAGFCEELVFRGFLINRLNVLVPSLWIAVLLASVIFAFFHSYQGWLGTLRSGVLGLILALIYLLTGSLPASMTAHALLDLTNVVLPKERVAQTSEQKVSGG